MLKKFKIYYCHLAFKNLNYYRLLSTDDIVLLKFRETIGNYNLINHVKTTSKIMDEGILATLLAASWNYQSAEQVKGWGNSQKDQIIGDHVRQ